MSRRAHLQPWLPELISVVLQHWHGPLLLQVLTLPEQPTIVLRHIPPHPPPPP